MYHLPDPEVSFRRTCPHRSRIVAQAKTFSTKAKRPVMAARSMQALALQKLLLAALIVL